MHKLDRITIIREDFMNLIGSGDWPGVMRHQIFGGQLPHHVQAFNPLGDIPISGAANGIEIGK
jgi:hypothetical protein